MPRTPQLFRRVALCAAVMPFALHAQSRRLELADSTRNGPRNDARPETSVSPRIEPRTEPTARAAVGRTAESATARRPALTQNSVHLVRDQTVLGVVLYAPSFAMAVADKGIPGIATALVVGAGSYFAASDYAAHHRVTGVGSDAATNGAVRGAIAGWALAQTTHADVHSTSGAIFLGSAAGMVGGFMSGNRMTEGEAAATTFGGDFLAVLGYGLGSSRANTAPNGRVGGAVAVGTALLGAPLGYLYASRASYRVTAGDVTTLWASAAIGATAAGTFIANGSPTSPTVAAVLGAGALAGAFMGDRYLVRTYDHSSVEGQLVALGALGGGVLGGGVSLLTVASHQRMSGATMAFAATGALAGMLLTEHYVVPRADAGRMLGRLELNPAGLLGIASGRRGAYPLGRVTF